MRIIAFINQKGGVGKTTTTINVGAGLAKLKKNVLLIDFDAQASLSCSLGIEAPKYSVYDLLKGKVKPEEVIISKGKLCIIPSSVDLSLLEGDVLMLKKLLQRIKGFDYILIDCPPALNLLTVNALMAAQELFIPVQLEFLSLQGLGQLLEVIKTIQEKNKALKIGGIIGTRFNRRKINNEVKEYLIENFVNLVNKTIIRENIALAEAPSFGQDIFSYNSKSNGAQDYFTLAKEINR